MNIILYIIFFLVFLLCLPAIINYLRGSIRLYEGKEVVEEMEEFVREYNSRKTNKN